MKNCYDYHEVYTLYFRQGIFVISIIGHVAGLDSKVRTFGRLIRITKALNKYKLPFASLHYTRERYMFPENISIGLSCINQRQKGTRILLQRTPPQPHTAISSPTQPAGSPTSSTQYEPRAHRISMKVNSVRTPTSSLLQRPTAGWDFGSVVIQRNQSGRRTESPSRYTHLQDAGLGNNRHLTLSTRATITAVMVSKAHQFFEIAL